MIQAFVSVGSNIHPRENMRAAILALAMQTEVVAVSTVYLTEPEGPAGQPSFFNCIVETMTQKGPDELKMQVLRRIETELGRRRSQDKYAPRTIDLDLVLYGDLVLKTGDLTIPDPGIGQKPFLAVPLSDLSPGLKLPGGDALTMAELAASFPSGKLRPLTAYTARLQAELRSLNLSKQSSIQQGAPIMKDNPLLQLEKLGQSIWLDYIRRDLMTDKGPDGETPLKRLIEDDGLRGMTSNPAIFEKAILSGHDYEAEIRSMAAEGMDAETIYENLTLRDVRMAADEFRPVYEKLDGKDGYVSLEVNPHLAHNTEGTVAEARRLWGALDRPNVFIKVPSTVEGLPAIRQLISEGINVNVTLLFGLPRYRQVVESYIAGIEARLAQGKDVKRVASVASFFVSRIDTLVDPMLRKIIAGNGPGTEIAKQTLGEVAVASAKSAYMIYKELFSSERFKKSAANGARTQRVLWASTGTKDPDYSDVKYVEALIGPDTVNTVPVETLKAYRDHGESMVRIDRDVAKAARILERLPELGISIDVITHQLEDDGVEKFNKAYDTLIKDLTGKL